MERVLEHDYIYINIYIKYICRVSVAVAFFCCFFLFLPPDILLFLLLCLLFILMAISNLICIQITSPGGTPIRGKNAGCNKTCSYAPLHLTVLHFLSSSFCHLSVSPFPALSHFCLLRHFLCLQPVTFQSCVWFLTRQIHTY